MEGKDKKSRIKYANFNAQSRDYRVNPNLTRKEITQPKVINSKIGLKFINSKLYDWRNHIESYPKSNNHIVDMDAKINHRKKREGD